MMVDGKSSNLAFLEICGRLYVLSTGLSQDVDDDDDSEYFNWLRINNKNISSQLLHINSHEVI